MLGRIKLDFLVGRLSSVGIARAEDDSVWLLSLPKKLFDGFKAL
jgi:hypothetical protein